MELLPDVDAGMSSSLPSSVLALPSSKKAALQREKKRALRERNLLDLSNRLATVADDPGAWFSDLVLLLGPERERVPAHRALLAASSPILRGLVLSAQQPSSASASGVAELELPEVDPQAFRLLLRFVYAGALPSGGLPAAVGLQLLALAERFDVPALAALCLDKYVRKVIAEENAFDLFTETYTEHRQQISLECLYFIEESFPKLLKHNREGFRKLPEEVLVEILKSDRLSVGDEYMLFLALLDWVQATLAREQPSSVSSPFSPSSPSLSASSSSSSSSGGPSSSIASLPPDLLSALRTRVAPLMAHIRFPLMSPQGLEEAEKTGLVPENLLYEAFRHHVLLRDGVVADKETGADDDDDEDEVGICSSSSSSSSAAAAAGATLSDVKRREDNPRLRRRKYHTYFLWDPSWHGQNIQIEDKGRTVRKVKAGWYSLAVGSTGFSTGRHYWEIKVNGQEFSVGVVLKSLPSSQLDNYLGASTDGWAYEASAQRKCGGVRTSYGETYTDGDHVGVLLDLEQGHLSFFKNGKSMGPAYTDLPTGTPLFPAIGWRDGTGTIVPAWCCSMDL